MDAIETIRKGQYTAEITYDDYPCSPREWDNLGHIIYTSTKYTLGDEKVSRDELDRRLGELEKTDAVILWVYAYIHGGVALSTKSFYGRVPQGHARFDSGICGIIYATEEAIERGYGKVNEETRAKTEKVLAGEIETFNQYAQGLVYRYTIKDKFGDVVEVIGGFYGTDYVYDDAERAVDHLIERDEESYQEDVQNALSMRARKLRAYIEHGVPLGKRKEFEMPGRPYA